MKFHLLVKQEALQDIEDAMIWYAPKAFDLDKKFLTAVEDTLLRILNNPFAFKKIYKNFRQTAIKVFPYIILYEPVNDIIFIYAVFNTWQDPQKKIRRTKK